MSFSWTHKCQYASHLTDYSSEYGTLGSSTYDASNVLGAPGSYINGSTYGDHVSSLVFRTYGEYWNNLPYHKYYQPIGHQPDWFQASDFIELQFDDPVYPTDVRVYETFCPGGLVRILISDLGTEIPEGTPHLSRWKVIWSSSSFKGEHLYTIATPKLPKHNKNSIATSRVRLEFDDKLAEYYHELDAVELVGHPWTKGITASEYLLKRIKKAVSVSIPTKMLKDLKIEDKTATKSENNVDACASATEVENTESKVNYFDRLPLEVVQMIISYIGDLRHRGQVSRVCQLFHKMVADRTAVKELNLRPYYTKINGDALVNLTATYSTSITKLDLSWSGFNYGSINLKVVVESLKSLPNLLELKCRNCHSFVHDEFLTSLAANCQKLKLLDLFRCKEFTLSLLKPLKELEYLDISQCSDVDYHEDVDTEGSEGSFFESCRDLKWFLMGRTSQYMFSSKPHVVCAELILRDMVKHSKEIHGVNFWRQRGIGKHFAEFIEKFGNTLKYLDLGWTGLHQYPTNLHWNPKKFWKLLQGSCPNLEYLALTSVNMRMDDEDLTNFTKHCPNLEQLDLLGVRGFTDIGLHALLSGCKNMKFLDLSYGGTTVETVSELKEAYPQCGIKHVPSILEVNKVLRRERGLDPSEDANGSVEHEE